MKKNLRKLLPLLLISMILSISAYATNTENEMSNTGEMVTYQCEKELAPDEILSRIENGITDVSDDNMPVEVTQSLGGYSEGIEMTYVGSTTQLQKQRITADGETVSEYETTAVYNLNENIANKIVPTNKDTVSLFSKDDPSYSMTMYLTLQYSENTDPSEPLLLVKLNSIHTYFIRNDPVLNVSKVQLYEESAGKMYDDSKNYLGLLDYDSNPRYLAYKDNPETSTVYTPTNCTAVSSLTGYNVNWCGTPAPFGFIKGSATYTMVRPSGHSWTGTISVTIFNNANIEE